MSSEDVAHEFDFDALADGYRHRPPSRGALERARSAAAIALDPLVDIGGGPGHHAAVWASRGRRSIVVDRSAKMVASAGSVPHVSVVRGDAQALPLRSDSVGLAYFHLSIHYGSWRQMLDEAVRVVRPSGAIIVWTLDPDSIGGSSLGRWFPSIESIDRRRFPDPTCIAEHLGQHDRTVGMASELDHIERSAREWIDAVRAGFVSSLQAVPEEEIEDGLAAFRRAYPNDDDVYSYGIGFVRIASVPAPLRCEPRRDKERIDGRRRHCATR